MTTEEQEKPAESRPKKVGVVGIGWRAYQQIAAIIGAFAILAFLTNFVGFDWRGWLATLIGVWDEFVRPPVQWLMHYVVEVPLTWVSLDVEVPQAVRDYVAVGFVLAGSVFRVLLAGGSYRRGLPRRQWRPVWKAIALLLLSLLVWPATTVANAAVAVEYLKKDRDLAIDAILANSPLLYAALLVALNYLVL